MARKKVEKVLETIDGEEVVEESTEWYATEGFKEPKDWDWKKVRAMWKSLKMGSIAYDPFHIPLSYKDKNRCSYYMMISKRGVGKTTSFVLLGIILFILYGCKTVYIRQTSDMIKPKVSQELLATILACGYIEKLTKGRWNSVNFYAGRWTFANEDQNGKIIEKSGIVFMQSLSIDQSFLYKSSLNIPTGNFIIFDEFIGKHYYANEFVYFLDILSTVIRKRTGVPIIMLSNNIGEFSEYFDEFEIYDRVRDMKKGDCDIVTSSGGTRVYVELIDHHDKNGAKLNREYFGFKNPMLVAITGEGEWNVTLHQHYDIEDKTVEIIDNRHFVKLGLNYLKLQICNSEKYGLFLRAQKATKIYEDSIIYTNDLIEDKRYRKYRGFSKVDKLLWTLYDRGNIHYATNSCKNFLDKYLD